MNAIPYRASIDVVKMRQMAERVVQLRAKAFEFIGQLDKGCVVPSSPENKSPGGPPKLNQPDGKK